MFTIKDVEKITVFMLNNSPTHPLENRPVYRNVENHGIAKSSTNDNIIRRMRFACRLTKATSTHSEYVVLNCFPQQ